MNTNEVALIVVTVAFLVVGLIGIVLIISGLTQLMLIR